jgi:DNA polymerase/3'-5' exonuclease PolX
VTERERIPLEDGMMLAEEVVDLLRGSCTRIEIAGSLRRQRPTVGDLEIVCIPKLETRSADLFGEQVEWADLLSETVERLLASGALKPRLDKNGVATVRGKSRRLLYCGFPLDLFATTVESWGCIYLIRTGPTEFCQQLVLKRSQGGWLPRGLFFRGGRLWQLPPPYDAAQVADAEPIPTPEEEDVFKAMGFAFLPPWLRAEQMPAVIR